MQAANAVVSLRIYADSPGPLMLSIAIKIKIILYYEYIEIIYY